jgi:flagellar hook-associated protein 3 FlgL
MINKNRFTIFRGIRQIWILCQNQLATGKSVRIPRDNPVAATNQMLYQTRLSEIDQYIKNISETQARLNEIDTALQSSLRIFQRIRELAVQGANGIYSNFERKEAAAAEMNKLLEELVAIANQKGATGRSIFGGFNTGTEGNRSLCANIHDSYCWQAGGCNDWG